MFLLGVALIGGGFLLGFLIGRWWALATPLVIIIYMLVETSSLPESDIPWGVVALAYAFWNGVGVLSGLFARWLVNHFANPS
jgi:hypothetical protein